MSVDYKETIAYAEFWRTGIAPHLRHLTEGSTNFSDYLQAYYKTTSVTKTFGLPLPYLYTLEFLEKFKDKCVTFLYNSPEDVNKGASPMSVIYQFSPTMHGLVNVHFWRDEGNNDGHVTTFLIYEGLQEVLKFSEDNMYIIKQPKPQQKGFALVA